MKTKLNFVFLGYILMIVILFLELFDVRGLKAKIEPREFYETIHYNSFGLVPLIIIMLQTNFDQKYKNGIMLLIGVVNIVGYTYNEFDGNDEEEFIVLYLVECLPNICFLMFGICFFCVIANRIIKELLTSIVKAETSKQNLNLILDNLEASIIIIDEG